MSNVSKRKKDSSRGKIKTMGDHKEFLKRITKTLYYGQLPTLPCLSLPVTEISCELWSVAQRGRSLRRLHADAAAATARSACVSPCALVLAILYLERLKRCNPDYLVAAAPAELFLVSLMVSNKFLQDDGEDDEVICSEWATSGGLELDQLKKLEVEFLNAIEWRVYVSEQSFECGLSWLERQVALRQARLRGFFTYGDLACSSDGALSGELACALAAAAACLAALAALLAAALLAAHPALRLLASAAARNDPIASLALAPHTVELAALDLPIRESNETVDFIDFHTYRLADAPERDLRCCREWRRHRDEAAEPRRRRDEAEATRASAAGEPWWGRAAALGWLYRSSLVSPMQRWLERMTRYSDEASPPAPVPAAPRACVTQWLNLSRLGMYAAALSDR